MPIPTPQPAPLSPPFWEQPAIYITALLMPLVYYVVYKVMNGVGGEQMQTMVITAIVSGTLGAIVGFWLATSFSSAKKDDAIMANQAAPTTTVNQAAPGKVDINQGETKP